MHIKFGINSDCIMYSHCNVFSDIFVSHTTGTNEYSSENRMLLVGV